MEKKAKKKTVDREKAMKHVREEMSKPGPVFKTLEEQIDSAWNDYVLEKAKKGKKGKNWNPNPWAVCHSKLGPKKTAKFERCVHHVKAKQK